MTKTLLRSLTLAAVAGLALPALAAEGGPALKLTTRSAEAEKLVRESVRRIESLQFGAQIQEPAKKAVELDPGFAWAHYLVAVSSFTPEQGQAEFDQALELVKKASPGEQQYLAAATLNRQQKPAEALAAFEKLVAAYPGERMAWMMVGQLAMAQGQVERARQAYDKAAALDASTPRVHTFIGNLDLLEDRPAQARARFEKALAVAPPGNAPVGAYYSVALSYLYEGQPDPALRTLDTLLAEYRKNNQNAAFPEVFIWNSMARVNLENGRPEKALEAYQKGFESVPGSSLDEQQKQIWLGRLHHGKARTLARLGRHDEAWKEAEVVRGMIEKGGKDGEQFKPAYEYLVGYLKLEAGEVPAAVEHLKQADGNDDFHRLLLARAYERAGDKAAAQKLYQEIVASRAPTLERALAYPEARRKLAS